MRRFPAFPAARRLPRGRALTLAVSLLLPAVALAAPPEEGPPPCDCPCAEGGGADEDPAMVRAQTLFQAGVALYGSADYGGAIDKWVEAYNTVPSVFENRTVKAELVYNVARAQQKWFDVDTDIEHLRAARSSMENYVAEIPTIYTPELATVERARAQGLIDELSEDIAAAEEAERKRQEALAAAMAPKIDPELDRRERRRNRAMIGSGAALTTIGLAGVGVLATGAVVAGDADEQVEDLFLESQASEREDQLERGQNANAMMVIGGISAGVFLAAGIPLLSTGIVFEKRRRKYVDEATAVVVPVRGGVGVSFAGKF